MKTFRYFLLIFIIHIFVFPIFSQNPKWIAYDTTNSGLLSQMVYCIALDKFGNKWMGNHTYTGLGFNTSGDGLVKFDGTDWTVYDTLNSEIPTNTVRYISVDQSNNKWIGTGWAWTGWEFIRERGVIKFDGSQWSVYDTTNSKLPSDDISCIAIDNLGNKWIGTGTTWWERWPGTGLAKFDGLNCVVYDTSNSEIPSNHISCVLVDDYNNKWIGTYDRGLAKFDGSEWTLYNTLNSELPSNEISCVAIDEFDNTWIGTGPTRPEWPSGEGLAKFDGINWIVYNTSNSEIPSNHISCIVIDDYDNKWIGTYGGGLAKFDGTNWTVYNELNSGLTDNWINCIVIDQSGNKWIGTGWSGLAVFNEGGVVSVDEDITFQGITPTDYLLHQNYPNPFNPSTTIKFTLPKTEFVELKVYNILGKEVATLVSNKLNQGNHIYQFDGSGFASGIYYYQLMAGDYREVKKMILLK